MNQLLYQLDRETKWNVILKFTHIAISNVWILNSKMCPIERSAWGSIPHIGIDIRPPVVRQCSPSGKVPKISFGQLFGKELGVIGLEYCRGWVEVVCVVKMGAIEAILEMFKLFWKCYDHLGWRRNFLVIFALSLMSRRLKGLMPSSKKYNHLRCSELKVPWMVKMSAIQRVVACRWRKTSTWL